MTLRDKWSDVVLQGLTQFDEWENGTRVLLCDVEQGIGCDVVGGCGECVECVEWYGVGMWGVVCSGVVEVCICWSVWLVEWYGVVWSGVYMKRQ